MAYLHNEDIETEPLFPVDESWLRCGVPSELAKVIALEYAEEDRQGLAEAASKAALQEVGEAHINPFVTNVAQSAVRLALGLKPLPAAQEGEN